MRDSDRRTGAFAVGALLIGAAFGLAGFGAGVAVGSDPGPRLASDAVTRYWTDAFVPGSERELELRVLAGPSGSILVAYWEVLPGIGRIDAMKSDVYRVRADSREPLRVRVGDGERLCIVRPHAEWGRVHQDTGLGLDVAFAFAD